MKGRDNAEWIFFRQVEQLEGKLFQHQPANARLDFRGGTGKLGDPPNCLNNSRLEFMTQAGLSKLVVPENGLNIRFGRWLDVNALHCLRPS